MTANMNNPAFARPGSMVSDGASGLTTRDYAAIHLRLVPEPGETLDDMIRRAERRDLAAQLFAAIVPKLNVRRGDDGREVSCALADALLAALRETKEPKP